MKYTRFNHRIFEIHSMVYDHITSGSTVLDIGCASGYFARTLQKKHCHVTGIDIDRQAIRLAKKQCDRVIIADLDADERKRIPKNKYDFILVLDIIEHLKHADELLLELTKRLSKNGHIIISTPNIAHISIRWGLLTGHFDYTDYGILDRTHIHFFTRETLTDFLLSKGFRIISITPSADFGQIPLFGRFLRHIPKHIQWHITKLFPTFLGVQWLVTATR